MRQRIARVRYVAPLPAGVEVMTLDQLRAMAPPGYLSSPQRPEFHALILMSSGRTVHTVDFHEHVLTPASGVWVRPGQVQRFAIEDRTVNGDLVLFQPGCLLAGTRAAALADDRFGPCALHIDPIHRDRVDRARTALADEYAAALRLARDGSGPAASSEELCHLLSVLLLRLARATATPATEADSSPTATLYTRFRDRVESDFAAHHDVDHYADALGYSARSLVRATRAGSGQTPKEVIQERIALEAGRLLAHSSRPIGSIATAVGFSDPSNFATFFVGQVGLTPSAFRDRHGARDQPRAPKAGDPISTGRLPAA